MTKKHKKMLSITHHQVKGTQNYTDRLPHTPQNGYHQNKQTVLHSRISLLNKQKLSTDENVEKLFTVGGNVRQYSCYGKESDSFLSNQIYIYRHDSEISTPGTNPREMKTCPHEDIYMNVYSSFIHDIPHYTQLSCPSVGEWLNKLWWLVHHSMECYSTIKRGNLLIYMHQPE